MDDETWARHSNPLSGWTRVPILPLITLAIWSRVWLGWYVLIPVLGVVLWTWLNPRLFGPPATQDAWMTQGVLGERIWLDRKNNPIPKHHNRVTKALNIASAMGVVVLIVGIWRFDLGLT